MTVKVTDAEVSEAAEVVSTLLQKARNTVAETFGEEQATNNIPLVEDVFFQMVNFIYFKKD